MKMTLLENIYHHLHHNGLTNSREHFSIKYLGKSKNWYAVQTHEQRDFSTNTAIACLRNIRFGLCDPTLDDTQRLALRTAERLVTQHLNAVHSAVPMF